MKNLVHHLNTDINGITEWAMIFYVVFPCLLYTSDAADE